MDDVKNQILLEVRTAVGRLIINECPVGELIEDGDEELGKQVEAIANQVAKNLLELFNIRKNSKNPLWSRSYKKRAAAYRATMEKPDLEDQMQRIEREIRELPEGERIIREHVEKP